ncbi:MBL fold metallo-hydrolase [Myroides pelagicus]|uniref:3',5'-cyclic-nucleotide phosphodiesterase n=1 Tax=Myroides pelagicus TaxID=270914 RepID=A0A7K1GMH1_9FLAO|nr:3',5'-cyclic-nucleotide phosphodiesterase [Myroides pelagicus]MEC4114364.1 3',5'-cyclic-nucleotide phosphodiesterase [Myroides pelagicus]MTH30087.1 3',5'-cyclic-nucleotide phosphodiesterase [Myroides pelagicus]
MKKTILGLCLISTLYSYAQKLEIIPLGVYGGGIESNLSCYLIGVEESQSYIALDAGTIRAGIEKTIEHRTFNTTTENILQNYIKGYFISHGHLDHLSGLIINSPDDSRKPIYGLPFVIDVFKNNYFRNSSWANFGSEGEKPIIGKYQYKALSPYQTFELENTSLTAEVFELSHVNPQKSSAILVRNNDEYILYFGDTGADRVEKTDNLNKIWEYIAPLIQNKNLHTILIEVSFPNLQPENKLYGHLTPNLLQEELTKLDHLSNHSLEGINIVITHLKPKGDQIKIIKQELESNNPFKVNYIFPEQGKKIPL